MSTKIDWKNARCELCNAVYYDFVDGWEYYFSEKLFTCPDHKLAKYMLSKKLSTKTPIIT